MSSLAGVLTVLSAMITPAVLISACGSLTISTSNRLARVIDRTRKMLDQLRHLTPPATPDPIFEEERAAVYRQLNQAIERSRLLHRALTCMYLALSAFVLTSVFIAIVALSGERFTWMPLMTGVVGAGLLFFGTVLLILEAGMARTAINEEMAFAIHISEKYVPIELVESNKRRRWRAARPRIPI